MDNKLKIINFLGKNMGRGYTMHELSKMLNIPYATFYRSIHAMNCIISSENIGKAKVGKLNFNSQAIKSYLVVSSEEEKNDFLEKQPLMKKIACELQTKDIVLVFGSYAKGTQRKDSDIDIMVINKSGNKDISFRRYEQLFKVKINPIFITINEFKAMLKEGEENVGKQAMKHHVVLNNPEPFWRCVLDGV